MKYLKYGLLPLAILLIMFFTFNLSQKEKEEKEEELLAVDTMPIAAGKPGTPAPPAAAPQPITFAVNAKAAIPNAERIGMNLSFRTWYGAEQYIRNVLWNPGFEGQIDRILVIVQEKDKKSFSDNNDGLGAPDGYWDGATFEVRSGESAGVKGKISKSLKNGKNNLPQYFTEDQAPTLAAKDVVAITKITNPSQPGGWWTSNKDVVFVDTSEARPGSPGTCSVALAPTKKIDGAELIAYLDTQQGVAGNLLSVTGPWNLSFWIKGEGPVNEVSVSFSRLNGNPDFIKQNFPVTKEWQQINHNFTGADTSKLGNIKFSIANYAPDTKVWIDDIQLGPVQSGNPTTAWRQDVIDMLRQLNPSYIRDWQLQLADTTKNRIADQFGRKCSGFRNWGGAPAIEYLYSIPEVLDLCTQVGANPWIIIPTTLGDEECAAMGLYLGQHADKSKFSDVVIEFGNENWNGIFRSESINYPDILTPVADRLFSHITASAGPNIHLTKVIGGQFANPDLTFQLAAGSHTMDKASVAAYFFGGMDAGKSNTDYLKEMFQDNTPLMKQVIQLLKPTGKGLNIYEINIGPIEGSAKAEERIPYTVGAVTGTALAKQLIDQSFFNTSPANIFCFAQYSTNLWNVSGQVDLYGVCRDVWTTKRWRPTGLATIMLNQIIGGSLYGLRPVPPQSGQVPPEAKNITTSAYRTGNRWSAAIASANPKPMDVAIQFPDDGNDLPTKMNLLKYTNGYFDTNEESELVKITSQPVQTNKRTVTVTLPAYGFAVLLSSAQPNKQKSSPGAASEKDPTMVPTPFPQPPPQGQPTPTGATGGTGPTGPKTPSNKLKNKLAQADDVEQPDLEEDSIYEEADQQ
jgi:hypothetical protein